DGDPDIKRMLALDRRPQLSADQSIHLHFALGKALDDVGKFDQAFAYYRKGNQQQRKHLETSVEGIAEQFARLPAIFSRDEIARLRQAGSTSKKPVFVIGMPRSGTTLLEQVLCAHPAIGTAGELRTLAQEARRIAHTVQQPWPDCVMQTQGEQIAQAADRYLTALGARIPDKPIVIDKMPQNFLHAGFAACLFPEAMILHCERDPLDTCLSNYFQLFPRGIDFAYDLTDLGHYYRQYQQLMTHWKTVLGEQLFQVRYEELISDPKIVLEPFLNTLGLSWDEALLNHQEHVGRVDTLSLYQVRQPLHQRSTQRWRKYEKHLGELVAALEK
ncbi:MAG: sulfotransferase, partial [Gammaproteobacteria bacterium]